MRCDMNDVPKKERERHEQANAGILSESEA
jgi:hypothetical protein